MDNNELKPIEDFNTPNISNVPNEYENDYTEELDLGEIEEAESVYNSHDDGEVGSENGVDNNLENIPLSNKVESINPIEEVETQDMNTENMFNGVIEETTISDEVEPITPIEEVETQDMNTGNMFNGVIEETTISDEVEPITPIEEVETQDMNTENMLNGVIEETTASDEVEPITPIEEVETQAVDVQSMFDGVTVEEPVATVNDVEVNTGDKAQDVNVNQDNNKIEPVTTIMSEHPDAKIKLNFNNETEEPENIDPKDIKIDIKGNQSLRYVVILGLLLLIIIILLPMFI